MKRIMVPASLITVTYLRGVSGWYLAEQYHEKTNPLDVCVIMYTTSGAYYGEITETI
jgi:hypothetical protein